MRSPVMEPTITSGQALRVDRSIYINKTPQRFDIVVFQFPQEDRFPQEESFLSALRIVGLPGESIQLRSYGIKVNDRILPYPDEINQTNINMYFARYGVNEEFYVPSNHVFLVGDNLRVAKDSRIWGSLHMSNIVGRITGATEKKR